MSHVDDAINEMFQATHMQMMRNCCRLEKMLLAAVLMESRARGQLLCCLCQANPMCCKMNLRMACGMHCSVSRASKQSRANKLHD